MSLITSCPACGTMFRVVPDQLKISEGWVRCGHCSEVFDATAHLSDESVLVEPPTAEQATRPVDLPPRAAERPAPPAELPSPAAEVPPPAPEPPPRGAAERSSEPSSFFGVDSQSLEPSPLDTPFVFRPSDLVNEERDISVLPPEPRASQFAPDDELEEPTRAELQDVSFVRQARRQAFWRRPSVRIALALSSLLLAALLLLQVAYHDRDRLALAQPALRPALERMCELAACTLGAPRQIESIVIDSSGFNRVRGDTYRLAFTLRNAAQVAVAVPAMELTVTDSQDQTIARRVLTPVELGAGGAAIPAAGEWSRAVGVVLNTGSAARVAGYRLLAFYP